jgi:hypothetical protein
MILLDPSSRHLTELGGDPPPLGDVPAEDIDSGQVPAPALSAPKGSMGTFAGMMVMGICDANFATK